MKKAIIAFSLIVTGALMMWLWLLIRGHEVRVFGRLDRAMSPYDFHDVRLICSTGYFRENKHLFELDESSARSLNLDEWSEVDQNTIDFITKPLIDGRTKLNIPWDKSVIYTIGGERSASDVYIIRVNDGRTYILLDVH
jgi:hypothetical protein